MITELTLRFGSAPGIPAAPIPTTPVTVFVGPNNSGKSKVLAEIQCFCANPMVMRSATILFCAIFGSNRCHVMT
jgi:predicted ATPase